MCHPRRQNYLFGTCENTTSSKCLSKNIIFFVTQFENNIHLYYYNRKNLYITFYQKVFGLFEIIVLLIPNLTHKIMICI